MRNGRVSAREDRMAGKGRGGTPRVGSHPMSEILEKPVAELI